MDSDALDTARLSDLVRRFQEGDHDAREDLIRHSSGRLEALARRMLRAEVRLRRWEETADVVVNAQVRLLKALREVTLSSTVEFFRLAACQIRRELLDLARHYYGPEGIGTHHASVAGQALSADRAFPEPVAREDSPEDVLAWVEFHGRVETLPEAERSVVDLHFYQGLSLRDVGERLGVTHTTVQNRWRKALMALKEVILGLPESF
jgi:RNA polymerase sigma factor (sigma-70 family)